MIRQIFDFGEQLPWLFRMTTNAGYAYLLMEPLFTYGVGFGLVLFILAYAFQERKSRTFGLLLLIICGAAMYPYQIKRNEAAPRPAPEYNSYWQSEGPRKMWDEQTARRSYFSKAYYLLALVGLLSLVAPPESGGLGKICALGVIGLGTGVLIVGLWLSLHDKIIFHPDLQRTISWSAQGRT